MSVCLSELMNVCLICYFIRELYFVHDTKCEWLACIYVQLTPPPCARVCAKGISAALVLWWSSFRCDCFHLRIRSCVLAFSALLLSDLVEVSVWVSEEPRHTAAPANLKNFVARRLDPCQGVVSGSNRRSRSSSLPGLSSFTHGL